MMLLKSCPRCGGDLSVEHDHACSFLECVQCGHILSRAQEKALGVRVSARGVIEHAAHRQARGTNKPDQRSPALAVESKVS